MDRVLTLYDAPRCPYCARVRILLAEKGVEYEPVEIDLDDRPPWLHEKNPLGKVPVLEEGDFVLPESRVIMEYLEERYPDPPLLPSDPSERALVRLSFERFVDLSGPYYEVLFGGKPVEELAAALARLDAALSANPYLVGSRFTLADIAYVPWIIRAVGGAGIDRDRHPNVDRWLGRLADRPSIAAELRVAGSHRALEV
jgi:glutathione S-transferase